VAKPKQSRNSVFAVSGMGVRALTPLEMGGLCAQCEQHFATVEAPDRDGAKVRLCHECVRERLEKEQPTLEQLAARAADQFREAERTKTPEELGRLAEWHDEWWAAKGEPMPAILSDIVARHRASIPPLATPVLDAVVTPQAIRLANLTLLIMRGALCNEAMVTGDDCIVYPNPSPRPRGNAAELLARMPKPLDCFARAVGDTMAVRCRTITEPSRLAAMRWHEEYWKKRGGQYANVRRRYGEQYGLAKMYWIGCHESLVTTMSEAELWEREYHVSPQSRGGSWVGSYFASHPSGARAAAADGAIYVMNCSHVALDDDDEETGRRIVVRASHLPDAEIVYQLTEGMTVSCEACNERHASWLATDLRTTPWKERFLCETCTAREVAPVAIASAALFEGWVRLLPEKGRQAAEIRQGLERLERWWRKLPAPAEVLAALDRCRRL
jgi:hypothetical protein